MRGSYDRAVSSLTHPNASQTPLAVMRRTLSRSASLSGITLFTGERASITIRPERDGRGIVFRRIDLPGQPAIRAGVIHVVPEARRTVLSADPDERGAATVQTVEHVMSALAGMGVTDAMVEVSGPEIPIGDGSATPFVEMIASAGVVTAGATSRPTARVVESIVIEDGTTRIEAHPTERAGLELTYRLEYPAGSPIAAQEASVFVPLGMPAEGYAEGVAPARTFCLRQEAEAMRAMGMFKHLSAREMLVIGEDGPIENEYRFADEPARHKLLDLLGDLALCGRPVVGRVVATRTGHSHNHAMAAKLAGLENGIGSA